MMKFNNTYSKLPERFFEKTMPATFEEPKLISFNYNLADELGIDTNEVSDGELSLIFSGQRILEGSNPIAQAYAGHQFGHFNEQLGDGRAHLLGEVKGFDIQLKGSGKTRFSRGGDGKSALGPVVREYIVSEAMFHLGVPTTRALAAVATGEHVFRNDYEPGGILTRVAPSHIRYGTFLYFSCRQDKEGLEILLNYAIERHFPKLKEIKSLPDRVLAFIKAVGDAQATLIAKWMSFGFIHGVMNTDNSSIGGVTLDFGPCAFMDEYKENKVFSSIDAGARYSYQNQIKVGPWNLLRMAECLITLVGEDQDTAVNKIEAMIIDVIDNFADQRWNEFAPKFGISDYKVSDQKIFNTFLEYLEEEELDFTLSFRNLESLYNDKNDFFPASKKLDNFITQWKERVTDLGSLNKVNPLFIARNHQVQRAIEHANRGDYTILKELSEVLKNPFKEQPEFSQYAVAPKAQERITETFCGT
jgi:uncharacterized protein YdiU (UPF0061 family)